MFNSAQSDSHQPKCHFTHSILPSYLDHAQIPLKKRPFSTISGQVFNQKFDLLLPASEGEILRSFIDKEEEGGRMRFATVYMKLADVVSGDFFSGYVKKAGSNILLLSHSNSDTTFSLHEGLLRLEVDKATFERMGLEGKPIPSEGRKHIATRYAIELNLRHPSMVRGKKGFERILCAFHHVLNDSVKWLFCDLESGKGELDEGPVSAHAPIIHDVEPSIHELKAVKVPRFSFSVVDDGAGGDEKNSEMEEEEEDDDESIAAILEWLTLAFLHSPRIHQNDTLDTALSRYTVPSHSDKIPTETRDLVQFQWHGLIPPSFIQKILLLALKATGTNKDSWFAMQGKSFDGKSYAFSQKGTETLTWEYED